MIAYKLIRVRKDGTLSPLFINRSIDIEIDRWYEAENVPTNGFAVRPGWHCTALPCAPHLKKEPKNETREWFEVEIEDYVAYKRPENQGGTWYLAQMMRVVRQLSETEIKVINKQGSLACETTDAS